jgi:hypothetical protein
MNRALIFFLVLLTATSSCGRPREAYVALVEENAESILPLRLVSVAGLRQGYQADARMIFTGTATMDSLIIDMEFAPGVPTKFVRGQYRWTQSGQVMTGDLMCRVIEFQGGQGDPPSVGGTFTIMREDIGTCKVYVPTTAMEHPGRTAPH